MIKSLEVLNNDSISLLEKNNLLLPLIKSELIESKLSTVKITDEDRDKIKNTFIQKNNFKDKKEFETFIKEKSLDENELINKAIFPLKIKRYSLNNFGHMVESRFIKQKADLDLVTYNFLRVKDRNLSQELFFRLQDGESDFSSLAIKFSEGIEKETNGLIGPISLNQAHPILKNQLLASKVNKVNPPILINEFWSISRLKEIKSAQLNDEMKESLAQQIFEENIIEEAGELHGKILK